MKLYISILILPNSLSIYAQKFVTIYLFAPAP
jgi:hypothetical protein